MSPAPGKSGAAKGGPSRPQAALPRAEGVVGACAAETACSSAGSGRVGAVGAVGAEGLLTPGPAGRLLIGGFEAVVKLC